MNLYDNSLPQEADEQPTEITFEEYEKLKAEYSVVLENLEALRRLNENPDFQRIIMTGYMDEEVQRLAALMASGKLPDASVKASVEQIAAVGHLKNHLRFLLDQGNLAQEEIRGLEIAYNASVEATPSE